jgi:hypothetical protein
LFDLISFLFDYFKFLSNKFFCPRNPLRFPQITTTKWGFYDSINLRNFNKFIIFYLHHLQWIVINKCIYLYYLRIIRTIKYSSMIRSTKKLLISLTIIIQFLFFILYLNIKILHKLKIEKPYISKVFLYCRTSFIFLNLIKSTNNK